MTDPDDSGHARSPRISVIVIRWDGSDWRDALFSLSAAHQREIFPPEYEVVVVDASSKVGSRPPLPDELDGDIRHVRVEGTTVSVSERVSAALAEARGDLVGLMHHGPRIVTPRVLRYALDAFEVCRDALVTVPDYRVPPETRAGAAHDGAPDGSTLVPSGWRRRGYGLFEVARPAEDAADPDRSPLFDLPHRPGLVFLRAEWLAKDRGRGSSEEGGQDSLAAPSAAGLLRRFPDLRWILLPGEGSFLVEGAGDLAPETGGEVPTGVASRSREASQSHLVGAARVRPFLVGAVTGSALPFVEAAAREASARWDGPIVARELVPPIENPDTNPRPGSRPTATVHLPPSMRGFRPWRPPSERWNVTLPLAYDLVEALRPGLLVAVGVREGTEFLSYCQSVLEHGLPTVCYGVGGWEDDAGSNSGEAVFLELCDHIRYRHSGFAYLLRMPSGEAADQFTPGSVDLVHLGEALPPTRMAEELDRWHSKLGPGGVLVCRDIGTPGSARREAWDRLAGGAEAFRFDGDPVPGVLRTPGGPKIDECPRLLRLLFASGPDDGERLRRAYGRIVRYLRLRSAIGLSEYGQARRDRPGAGSDADDPSA